MTKGAGRYDQSVAFLRNLDADWARLIDLVGPCLHDPKAAREPYEALVRAIAYQQLTAKAGDAIIGRLKALFKDAPFPTPANLIEADVEARPPRSRPSRLLPRALFPDRSPREPRLY